KALRDAVLPRPAPPPGASPKWLVGLLGGGLTLALILVWLLWGRPEPPPPPEKKVIEPAPKGWTQVDEETVEDVNGKNYYRQLKRTFGNQTVVVRAVPQTKT